VSNNLEAQRRNIQIEIIGVDIVQRWLTELHLLSHAVSDGLALLERIVEIERHAPRLALLGGELLEELLASRRHGLRRHAIGMTILAKPKTTILKCMWRI
jgi:hypothetical protein